ncbi:creatininase family protein [Rhizobium sp. Root482]|uniref:creatininase family protein n=1 Tax=Rhizobium sp. Root482 TaxID=1736543 RepID=UPI0006F6ABA3|nr:creatininase family protein [Rhizobium sp. Root482]KQY26967.1 creatininase [Rhizobium sp. Root482]
MHINAMNWSQVEERLKTDDRCIVPLGSIEQHAGLSLGTDMILPEKVALDAAAPLGVPVFPVMPYGLTAGFADFPGTVTLRIRTYIAVIEDILDSLYHTGFRRILMINGHGGNSPAATVIAEWLNRNRDASVKLHDWWRAPKTMAKVLEIDSRASHASWMENFPWTRLEGIDQPQNPKDRVDLDALARVDAGRKRDRLGDGCFHGLYERPDTDMLAIWNIAVEETRFQLENGWH